ncbi:hypothetical protein [Anditalea andensis]|nr:hypothetical protein [Anditalea andensis]
MLSVKNVFTHLLAVFLLALSLADHDEKVFVGKDYQSAAVEALDYDFVDFPTSVSRHNMPAFSKVQREAILPLAVVFKLEISNIIPTLKLPIQLYGIPLTILTVLELIVCSNAP